MNRIDQIFRDLRADGRRGLMPFLTGGDPDLAATGDLLVGLEKAGASICEIGFPFSDPVADGPVIQASMTAALDRGVTVEKLFEAVAAARPRVNLGLVAMVSYSIVHRWGLERFVGAARDAGFDGFIFPDLTLEEAGPARRVVAEAGMTLSMLIAATTPLPRAQQIAAASSGFAYVMARAGITGEQRELSADLPQRLAALRSVAPLPMAVGFGISDAGQVRQVVAEADAAIVGSALVRRIAEARERGIAQAVEAAVAFTAELATGLPQPAAAG